PASWSYGAEKISDTEYDLIIKAEIYEGWYIFSQFTDENGSLPSELTFEKAGEGYDLVGPTLESETVTEYSDIFGVNETFFREEAIFTQRIKLLDPAVSHVEVGLFYQICKDVCIPKDEVFYISLTGEEVLVVEKEVDDRSKELGAALIIDLKNKELLVAGDRDHVNEKTGMWMIFGLGFLGGLIALLTPCVFPMIPLTVSFFTKQSGDKSRGIGNALLYGFFIVLIYFLLSLPFHLFDSVDS